METGFYGSVGDAQGTNSLFFCLPLTYTCGWAGLSKALTPVAFQQLWIQPKELKGKYRERLFQNLGDRPSLCTDVLETLRVAVFCPGVKSTNHKASSLLAL